MNMPSPSQPGQPEKLPASPSNEPAMADGAPVGPTSIAAGGSAGRDWSNLPELRESHFRRSRRRLALPLALFVATCFSTLWVGSAGWRPQSYSINDIPTIIGAHWE